MLQCVYLSLADAEHLNSIMFANFMFDGENYIFPFMEGTQYIDPERIPVIVDGNMIANMQNFIADPNQSQIDRDFMQNVLSNLEPYIPPLPILE